MKIHLPSFLIAFVVFRPAVDTKQIITTPAKAKTTTCFRNYEKLPLSEISDPTMFNKTLARREEINAAERKAHYHRSPFNWWSACKKIGGQCKNHCGQGELKIVYCSRPEFVCCGKECDPNTTEETV